MKEYRYQALLTMELVKIGELLGKEKMQFILEDLKPAGIEAMGREVILQLLAEHFTFRERAKYLAKHRDLVIPFLFRIKIKP